MKIGLIKEGKVPPDTRVALSPAQCVKLSSNFPELKLLIQASSNRCFSDEEYLENGQIIQDDLSECDVFLGIKEVPIDDLIENKTYLFFSHTKKKQAYNQKLMQALIAKKIRMIDYEALTYENGKRIIGFGFFAGVVGAHNALLTYGNKTGKFLLKPANQCKDMACMEAQYEAIKFPPIKIVITGDGRVGQGIRHILHSMRIKEVSENEFLNQGFDEPVFVHLTNDKLYQNKETKIYDREEFHHFPERYECIFTKFFSADILINGIYWDTKIPRLFERADVHRPEYNISVIADVTCDENGSVPINLGASTIANPVYGYDKTKDERVAPFQNNKNTIDIMAVDNLPNELPRDASGTFGAMILELIIPELLKEKSEIIERAVICENGQLGKHFEYLKDYAFPVQIQ